MAGLDASGAFYVSDTQNEVVRRVINGTAFIVAGSLNRSGASGNGVPGTSALLRAPRGLALTASGDLLIADATTLRLLFTSTNNTIITFAGQLGVSGFAGDGGRGELIHVAFEGTMYRLSPHPPHLAATSARLTSIYSIKSDGSSGWYIVR